MDNPWLPTELIDDRELSLLLDPLEDWAHTFSFSFIEEGSSSYQSHSLGLLKHYLAGQHT